MRTDFNPFPELETKRLFLRGFDLNDAADLFEIRSNPDMIDYVDQNLDEFIDDTIRFINIINKGIKNKKWINWAIVYKDNSKVIGSINIWNLNDEENKAEIGFSLNPLYQGMGLMKEALDAIIEYGFTKMDLDKLEVWTDKRNEKALKLIEKSGFKFVKEVREKGYYKKQMFFMNVYERSKRD
jgi:ribosomal-protein-alanine N-acetyltransferase